MESEVQTAPLNERVRAGILPRVEPLQFNPFELMPQIKRKARRIRLRSRGYDFETINGYSTEAINRRFKLKAGASRLNWSPEYFRIEGRAFDEGYVGPAGLVMRAVCMRYGVKRDHLRSASRDNEIVRPRQIAMFLMRNVTALSLPDIGRRFGGRDHTTVLHAVRRVSKLVEIDSFIASEVQTLLDALRSAEAVSK